MSAGARILIVEDDAVVRDLLVALLRAEDYEVAAEATGTAALRRAQTFQPDLAVVDVRLEPGPDGFTVARRLREDRPVAVLFLTAAGEAEEDRKSTRLN